MTEEDRYRVLACYTHVRDARDALSHMMERDKYLIYSLSQLNHLEDILYQYATEGSKKQHHGEHL